MRTLAKKPIKKETRPMKKPVQKAATAVRLSPKEEAIKAFEKRKAKKPEQVDNASLYTGSPMYYYCRMCGHESDVLPECHFGAPKRLCTPCQEMQDMGWFG